MTELVLRKVTKFSPIHCLQISLLSCVVALISSAVRADSGLSFDSYPDKVVPQTQSDQPETASPAVPGAQSQAADPNAPGRDPSSNVPPAEAPAPGVSDATPQSEAAPAAGPQENPVSDPEQAVPPAL